MLLKMIKFAKYSCHKKSQISREICHARPPPPMEDDELKAFNVFMTEEGHL